MRFTLKMWLEIVFENEHPFCFYNQEETPPLSWSLAITGWPGIDRSINRLIDKQENEQEHRRETDKEETKQQNREQ